MQPLVNNSAFSARNVPVVPYHSSLKCAMNLHEGIHISSPQFLVLCILDTCSDDVLPAQSTQAIKAACTLDVPSGRLWDILLN